MTRRAAAPAAVIALLAPAAQPAAAAPAREAARAVPPVRALATRPFYGGSPVLVDGRVLFARPRRDGSLAVLAAPAAGGAAEDLVRVPPRRKGLGIFGWDLAASPAGLALRVTDSRTPDRLWAGPFPGPLSLVQDRTSPGAQTLDGTNLWAVPGGPLALEPTDRDGTRLRAMLRPLGAPARRAPLPAGADVRFLAVAGGSRGRPRPGLARGRVRGAGLRRRRRSPPAGPVGLDRADRARRLGRRRRRLDGRATRQRPPRLVAPGRAGAAHRGHRRGLRKGADRQRPHRLHAPGQCARRRARRRPRRDRAGAAGAVPRPTGGAGGRARLRRNARGLVERRLPVRRGGRARRVGAEGPARAVRADRGIVQGLRGRKPRSFRAARRPLPHRARPALPDRHPPVRRPAADRSPRGHRARGPAAHAAGAALAPRALAARRPAARARGARGRSRRVAGAWRSTRSTEARPPRRASFRRRGRA